MKLITFLRETVRDVGDFLTRTGPTGDDSYDRAEHGRALSDAELAVAAAILDSGGPVAGRLHRQLDGAPDVWRIRSADGGFELRISTSLPLGVTPPSRIASDSVSVRDSRSSRVLRLSVVVDRAAIAGLEGRTEDGLRWPKHWDADRADLDRIREQGPHITLPTAAEIRARRDQVGDALIDWVGDPTLADRARRVRPSDPADSSAIDQLELSQGVRLPADYREFLAIADGLEIGSLEILGTRDAYRLDTDVANRLIIVPADERGAIVLDEDGRVIHVGLGDPLDAGQELAGTFQAFARRRLEGRTRRSTS